MKDINSFYNDFKGKNKTERDVAKDLYGNLLGSEYDLAKDLAFKGMKIVVLHLYTGEGFDFSLPEAALKEKGFEIVRWKNRPPKADELEKVLTESSQLWIISSNTKYLKKNHLKVIKGFFENGGGLFIWGDNEPYYQDANFVAEEIFGTTMEGDTPGDKVVSLQLKPNTPGIVKGHPITTGLEFLYEGITIATVKHSAVLHPLMYGSDNNLVTAYYDKNGNRGIIDGGFTRLYHKWDTAGTARFVKNAAAWLANVENDTNRGVQATKVKRNLDAFNFDSKVKSTEETNKKSKPNIDDFNF